MSSGSLKDVVKAIHSIVPATELPLPDHLQEAIQAYLDKHLPIDDTDSQRLQDELLTIWQKIAKDKPERYLIFLNLLRELRPAIRGATRWVQWWETLVLPVLAHIGEIRGLAKECRHLLLDILVFEAEDGDTGRVEATLETSIAVSEKILEIWLKKSTAAMIENDLSAQYMEQQIKIVLMSFGQKRPKELLTILNKYFVKPENRSQILSLLVNFFRQGPPHLHLMLQTPLFENLLRCLQIDTSTTVVAQAMTALTMFLPHIPVTTGKHLPALFNIYTRMLFWEQERTLSSSLRPDSEDGNESAEAAPKEEKAPWQKIAYSFDKDDEALPDILHYFTFLYGLYPINFMSYIRKPGRYLRHANFPGADDVDIEPAEIRKRSEPFREQHLLHPNFFSLTIESELTDAQRWLNHAASDVVTFCMELNVPVHGTVYGEEGRATPTEPSHADRESIYERPRTLLQSNNASEEAFKSQSQRSSHDAYSSRSTRQNTVMSPDGVTELHALARLSSRSSQSIPSTEMNSPAVQPQDARHDSSGTITEFIAPLNEMMNSQHSLRSNLRRTLRNDSSTTLSSLANNDSATHVDAYINSLAPNPPRSPSLRPSGDPSTCIASLHREITLLKNDLSFERYLKAQHLSHIGKLRRQQVRDATVEAETQNLINGKKLAVMQMEEAKEQMKQMRRETERSRAQSRKWEADLTAKVRNLREEQRKWTAEREGLVRALAEERTNNDGLKKLVLEVEGREQESAQRLKGIQIELEGLERLKTDVDRLKQRLRKYQTEENDEERTRTEEGMREARVNMLKMQLHTRAREFEDRQAEAIREIESLKAQLQSSPQNARKKGDRKVQVIIDNALATSQKRLADAKKMHELLQKKYRELEEDHLKLQARFDQATAAPRPIIMSPLTSYIERRDPYVAPAPSSSGSTSASAKGKEKDRPSSSLRLPSLDEQGAALASYGGGSERGSTATASLQTRSAESGRSGTLSRGSSTKGTGQENLSPATTVPTRPAAMRANTERMDGSGKLRDKSALFRGNTVDGQSSPATGIGRGDGGNGAGAPGAGGGQGGPPGQPKGRQPEGGRLYGRGRSLFDSLF